MFDVIVTEEMAVPFGSHRGKYIYMGSDKEGSEYKNAIAKELTSENNKLKTIYHICHFGVSFPPLDDHVEIAEKVARYVNKLPFNSVGLYFSETGEEIIEASSQFPNIYAGRSLVPTAITRLRTEDNTNVLGIGTLYFDSETALQTVKTWLETPFSINNLEHFLKIASLR